jgi:DNA-binding response OmpR family regulator/S1-C subfamily serine protease
MINGREKIVVVEADDASRDLLRATIEGAGYEVAAFATTQEGLEAARQPGTDVLLLDPGAAGANWAVARETLAAMRGSAVTEGVRVIVLTSDGAGERTRGLDLGADDAISRPWDAAELLARVRTQLRVSRARQQLLHKLRIAEEGQQIAHTAFDALAVTEKMASDAVSINRRMKMGLAGVFAIAAAMATTYFLFAHSAQKDLQRTTATIARIERGIVHQQDLMADARKLRQQQGLGGTELAGKDELQKQAADLQAKMAAANSDEGVQLRKELDETNARLKRIEQEGDSAQNLIRSDVESVCLLHVSVAFRDQKSGQRLHYAGLNQQGEPLQDSEGNPVLTLAGNGPEVKVDVFGTGFPAGPAGRIVTNRHVAQPWWNNDELSELTNQGFTPEISSIHAYFPGDARAFTAEIQDISKDADLASMRVDLKDLKRAILTIDPAKDAAVTGEPIVLMGYATGLAAILARTDDDTAQRIMSHSGTDVSQVLDELARRNLIHPLITQGHIGDVLADKIVFDAQTTSGGSGGPLFNHQGRVIGVTYAVLRGFGGSNFGIPIKFSEPLLAFPSTHAGN